MKRYVNICDDGRGGYCFGELWTTERHALEEAKYLLPVPIAIAISVNIDFAADTVRAAIRAFERAGATS